VFFLYLDLLPKNDDEEKENQEEEEGEEHDEGMKFIHLKLFLFFFDISLQKTN